MSADLQLNHLQGGRDCLGKLQFPACRRGRAPKLCTLARRQSRDFSMAVFADLDLRVGSDLKALRGLVENAAHRESSWPLCLSSFGVCRTVGTCRRGRTGPCLVGVSGVSLETDAHPDVARIPNAGNPKALGSCYPV